MTLTSLTELELPTTNVEKFFQRVVPLDYGSTTIWPPQSSVQKLLEPQIYGSYFADAPLIWRQLYQPLINFAADAPKNTKANGGVKIRHHDFWGLPAARLISKRALILFCSIRQIRNAHIVDRWANVMQSQEYNAPHSHYDAEGAVVYSFDLGDVVPQEPMSGKLELLDSRIEFCNSTRPGHPTRGVLPDMQPGTMLHFPGSLIHFVHPYLGQKPRITFAFNICSGPAPRDYSEQMTQVVPSTSGVLR